MSDDNKDQRDFWTDGGGLNWLAYEADLDASFAEIDQHLIAAGQAAGDMQVMDLGCGTGRTTRRIAQALGAGGSVTGVDISSSLLDAARAEGGTGISYLEADAQDYAFGDGAFDLILSRFGSMFFADPVAGLANLRRSLVPGGKMVLACWRRGKENPWFLVPLKAAITHFGPVGEIDPTAPGPTAFGDENRVLGLLEQAGFAEAGVEVLDLSLRYPRGIEDFIALQFKIGSMTRLIAEHEPDDAAKDRAAQMIAVVFADSSSADQVLIPARINLFTAVA